MSTTSMASAFLLCICAISSLRCVSSASSSSSSLSSMCPHQSTPFLNTLQSQCPLFYTPNSPLEVGGDFLDRMSSSKWGNAYTSILFYASWCPFSHDVRLAFEVLSSMFPEIEHLAVEQSSAMPSILSRHGIHSLPTILIMNHTSRMRFCCSKDLHSLVKFYKKKTGWEPVDYVAMEQPIGLGSSGKLVMQSWVGSSSNEILMRDPYLVLSVLFLCVRVVIFLFLKIVSCFKAFWVSCGSHLHLNLEIFGEASQLLGRVLQMIDVKRVWTKLRLSKTRKFHQGAKNARVWASSLASVSLGET